MPVAEQKVARSEASTRRTTYGNKSALCSSCSFMKPRFEHTGRGVAALDSKLSHQGVSERMQQHETHSRVKLGGKFQSPRDAPTLVCFKEHKVEVLGLVDPVLDHVVLEVEEQALGPGSPKQEPKSASCGRVWPVDSLETLPGCRNRQVTRHG